MTLNTAVEIIEDIRQGKMVILMDDEAKESEGYLVMAAEKVTANHVNFMARNARGLICLTLMPEQCEKLNLSRMATERRANNGADFTVSIEAARGVTTGISAQDRATTIKTAVSPGVSKDDIARPGHVFPLRASPAGLLSRAGFTEAGCDLARLAGFVPSAVVVGIMNQDGSMSRRADLEAFAQQQELKMTTIDELIHYRLATEKTIEKVSEKAVETRYGPMRLLEYRDGVHNFLHIALVKGDVKASEPTLVRVCNMEPLRDIFGIGIREFSSWAIGDSLSMISDQDAGVLLMLENGQNKDSLLSKVELLEEREAAPFRQVLSDGAAHAIIGVGCQMLRDIGVGKMRLMSKEIKYTGLAGYDLEITEFLHPPEARNAIC